MIGNGLGTIINLILDPVFILAFHMGVAGAAIATVLGNVCSCLYLIHHVQKQHYFSLSLRHFTLRKEIAARTALLGIPMAAGTMLMSFSSIFLNHLLGGYGDVVIAASGVSGKIGMLLAMIAMGICMGIQPAISYNYGARQFARMRTIILRTALTTVVTGTLLTIVCFMMRDTIITAFIQDTEVIAYGQLIVMGSLVTAPVYGLYQLSSAFLQATQKVSYATFVSLLRQGIVYVPTLFIMNLAAGLYGLIFAAAVADTFSIIAGIVLSVSWYRKITTGNVPA